MIGEDFATLVIGKTLFSEISLAYPFKIDVQLEFTLSANKGLAVVIELHNLGEATAPVGVGYHPYFAAPKGLESYKLALPPCLEYEVDAQMIPTGIQHQNFTFNEGAMVDMALDTGYAFGRDLPIVLAQLTDNEINTTLTVWQMAGKTGMRYLQIYTPPTRDMIAIEPMSCPANAMKTGEGLLTLIPGQAASFSFGVRLDIFPT
jgi:aldose 1-epimerase